MKIASFTMVNNESEIIESFIRYNYNFLDEMIIIDNGCTDNTIDIINRLKFEEGYNIQVFDESLEAFELFKFENKYMNYICERGDVDIAIPLDADEFIMCQNANPRNVLEKLSLDRIYYVNWQWYVLTGTEDFNEAFIPKRMTHRLVREAWDYATGEPTTKVIIPVKYFKDNKLTLAAGHHFVSGINKFEVERLAKIKLAHYRLTSIEQVQYKSLCYSIRDIATMTLNTETAQRTNQVALIENNITDLSKLAIETSFCGYDCDIIKDPVDLQYCSSETSELKYTHLAYESLLSRVVEMGREMAIRTYNLELKKLKENSELVFWFDTNDSSSESKYKLQEAMRVYGARCLMSDCKDIEFTKWNNRLIITHKYLKFFPCSHIVLIEDSDRVREYLKFNGIPTAKIVTLNEL